MMYLKQTGSTRTDFAAFALIERDALEICNLPEYPRIENAAKQKA
jgi:hypothetical protein